MGWYVVTEFVGIVGQPTVVRLVPRLRPTRTSVLALLFLVRGRRLGRSPRRFIRPHQSTRPCSDAANQSDPSTHGFRDCNPWQGGGASVSILILIAAPKKGVGNYVVGEFICARFLAASSRKANCSFATKPWVV